MKYVPNWPHEVLLGAALTLVVIVALPILALAALFARGVLVPLLVVALVVGSFVFLFSHRFRRWLHEKTRPHDT